MRHFTKNKVNQLLKAYRDRYAQSINNRRAALAELYAEDDRIAAAKIASLVITPEQKMENMRIRVNELKVRILINALLTFT